MKKLLLILSVLFIGTANAQTPVQVFVANEGVMNTVFQERGTASTGTYVQFPNNKNVEFVIIQNTDGADNLLFALGGNADEIVAAAPTAYLSPGESLSLPMGISLLYLESSGAGTDYAVYGFYHSANVIRSLAPDFTKAFAPASVAVETPSTITFTIDNSLSSFDAESLTLVDILPSGLLISPIPSASTTCTGGRLEASANTSLIRYTGGSVAAGATCDIDVDVQAATAATYTNVASLESNQGNSGTATDTLTVTP